MIQNKYCSGCDKDKSIEDFGIDRSEKDGRRFQCKICRNKKQREYAKNNKEKIKERNKKKRESRKAYYQSPKGIESSRRAHLKRKYGISLEEYEKLSKKQNNKCAICTKEENSERNNFLCVDHNHSTGQIRGLLCSNCNRGLGLLKDNEIILNNAIKYLQND
ncbi:MAG: endonuclease VII domain-containing protein [Candidatus Riesia sp.]|nr:endonuclease VII domain-containing protein [Candidatus Riesia sp.]